MSRDQLVTRPLDPSCDQEGLIALFDRVFGGTVTPAMWQWKYLPPWAARFYCWVAVVGGDVVGYVGAVPLRGQVRGEEAPFFQLADMMVHPDHRRQHDYFDLGPRHILEDIGAAHPRHLLYGFSGHRAFRWFERTGLSGLIERAGTRYVRPGTTGTGDPRIRDLRIRDWDWSEPAIDAVWTQQRDTITAGLIRDGAYLRWRYARHPTNGYRLFGVDDGAQPLGWIVIGNDPPCTGGRAPEIPVVDVLLPEVALAGALAALAERLSRALMIWLPGRLAPSLGEQQDAGTNVFHFVRDSMVSTDFLRNHLYYTMGDVDWW